jgi:signal peptidase I
MAENSTKDFILPKFLLDILIDAVVVVVLVVLIRVFLFAPFQVNGQSMCNTFNYYDGECLSGDGEFVLTSRLSTWDLFGWSPTDIQRGDVVIFAAPYSEDGDYYIKRVIGLPGDTVKIEDGLVYVADENGKFIELDEPYLNSENAGNTQPYRVSSQIFEVPEDDYFVLGDNRTKSNDSRRCFQQTGCSGNTSPYLEMDRIEGEVKMVIYPFSHVHFVKTYSYSV